MKQAEIISLDVRKASAATILSASRFCQDILTIARNYSKQASVLADDEIACPRERKHCIGTARSSFAVGVETRETVYSKQTATSSWKESDFDAQSTTGAEKEIADTLHNKVGEASKRFLNSWSFVRVFLVQRLGHAGILYSLCFYL